MILLSDSTRKNYSVAFAFFGIFGYFFHRSQLKGVRMIGLVIGMMIMMKFMRSFVDIAVLEMIACGFVGGSFMNKHCMSRPDFDMVLFERRETIAAIAGLIMWTVFIFV